MSSSLPSDSGFFRNFYNKHMVFCNLVLMGVVIVFLGFFTMFFLDIWTNHGHTTVIPEVRKKNFGEAIEALKKANLEYEIYDSIYDTNMAPGMVKELWPHPGTTVKPGRTVYITINSFQPQRVTVSMPLTGVSSRQAITYLESLNVKNIRISYVPSNFPDLVEGAKIKGKSIVPGMQIPVNANVVLEVGQLAPGARQKANASTVDNSPKQEITEVPAEPEAEIDETPETPAPVETPEQTAPATTETPKSTPEGE